MPAYNRTTITDCFCKESKSIAKQNANLSIRETPAEIPFEVNRIYFIYNIPSNASRGGHSHYQLEQYIVPISGSFDVLLKDGKNTKTVSLSSPTQGLYIAPGIWRELVNFSSDAICLVYASLPYNEEDYIRNFEYFSQSKNL